MKKIVFLFFIISLLSGLIYSTIGVLPYADRSDYDIIARNLLEGKGYSLSLEEPYYPDLSRTPGYVLFLSAIYSVFGYNYIVVKIIQAILNAFVCILIFYLSRRYFDNRVAYTSSFLVALYPFTAAYVPVTIAEILALFLLVAAVLLFQKSIDKSSYFSLSVSAFLLGYATLTRPALALLPLMLSAGYFFWAKNQRRAKLWKMAVFNLIFVLIICPWSLRNYTVAKAPVFLSTEGSYQLYLASLQVKEAQGGYYYLNPDYEQQRQMLMQEWGEVSISGHYPPRILIKKYKVFLNLAIENIKKYPIAYTVSSLKRIVRVWITDLGIGENKHSMAMRFRWNNLLCIIAHWATTISLWLGIGGFVIVRKAWRRHMVLWLTMLYFSFSHMFLHVEARYSIPARPFLLIFNAIAILSIYDFVRNAINKYMNSNIRP